MRRKKNVKKKLSFVNIIFFVVFGVLTGVLWAYLCPIPLIPGAVHFRTFAFIIVVIGYLFGPVTGFFSGYIGTIVWALLSGNFIPLHSPLADGITVGLSAALPALVHMRGKKDLLAVIDEGKGKFIGLSLFWSLLFGVLMFLVPIPSGKSFTTLLDFVKTWISNLLGGSLIYIVTVLLVVAAVVSLIDFIFKPEVIRKNNYLRKAFSTTPLYLASKVIGAVTGVMVLFQVGPEVVISADTGGSIIDLCGTLLCILVAFSFVLPFLTDCGIMEFLGVITRPVVRPLFHVPGRAAVDLIASWFGASNAAVILTREQYMKGFYTKREAGYIMTNFSLVSVPFCLMVAETIGRDAP